MRTGEQGERGGEEEQPTHSAHIRCAEGKQKVALALLELIRDAPTGSTARREACGVLDLLARCALNLPEIGASAERLLPREDARKSTSRPK